MQVNAHFVPDIRREEVTWIGAMGIVVKGSRYKQLNDTKLRFMAKEGKIFLGEKVKLDAKGVAKIHLAKGKLTLDENERAGGAAEVDVVLEDVGLEFSVRFVKGNHLDMIWKKVLQQSKESHGLIGRFKVSFSCKGYSTLESAATLSFLEKLSFQNAMKGSRRASFVGRLSLSRRVLYRRFYCIAAS